MNLLFLMRLCGLLCLTTCVFSEFTLLESAHAVCAWACPEMAMPEVECQATCLANFIFFIIHDGKPPPDLVMRKPYSFVVGRSEVQEWKAGCDGMCDVLCEGIQKNVHSASKDFPQCKIDCFTSFLNGQWPITE